MQPYTVLALLNRTLLLRVAIFIPAVPVCNYVLCIIVHCEDYHVESVSCNWSNVVNNDNVHSNDCSGPSALCVCGVYTKWIVYGKYNLGNLLILYVCSWLIVVIVAVMAMGVQGQTRCNFCRGPRGYRGSKGDPGSCNLGVSYWDSTSSVMKMYIIIYNSQIAN